MIKAILLISLCFPCHASSICAGEKCGEDETILRQSNVQMKIGATDEAADAALNLLQLTLEMKTANPCAACSVPENEGYTPGTCVFSGGACATNDDQFWCADPATGEEQVPSCKEKKEKGDRENLLYRVKLLEQTEQFGDAVEIMIKVVELGESLSTEERNLLSVAFKNKLGPYRTSYRALSDILAKEKEEGKRKIVQEYLDKNAAKIKEISLSLFKLVDDSLLPAVGGDEAGGEDSTFYQKMKGDYAKYWLEVNPKSDKALSIASESYKKAADLASKSLKPEHPVRLGVALNYAEFLYGQNDVEGAAEIGKDAFNKAVANIENLNADQYKDSTLIMQLIRNNLEVWTAELQHNEVQNEAQE